MKRLASLGFSLLLVVMLNGCSLVASGVKMQGDKAYRTVTLLNLHEQEDGDMGFLFAFYHESNLKRLSLIQLYNKEEKSKPASP